MRFLIIENQIIVNYILAETKEIAEIVTGLQAIEIDNPQVLGATIGAVFDASLGVYLNPEPIAEITPE